MSEISAFKFRRSIRPTRSSTVHKTAASGEMNCRFKVQFSLRDVKTIRLYVIKAKGSFKSAMETSFC